MCDSIPAWESDDGFCGVMMTCVIHNQQSTIESTINKQRTA